MPTSPVGAHILADLCGVAADVLRDGAVLESVLRAAAAAAGSRVLSGHFHRFGESGGITGVVLLAESHMSIHTWPEFEFAAADIFMCGASDPTRALQVLLAALKPTRQFIRSETRGLMEPTVRGVSGGRNGEHPPSSCNNPERS
jgi:S-adenosylmethionine decarboxylase